MIEDTWAYLDNSWYYFCGENISGYKQGQIIHDKWIRYKGNYYFMALDGRMATNTWVHNPSTNGEWYVNNSGIYDPDHKKNEIDSFSTKYMRSGYRWEYRYHSGQRNIRYRISFLAVKGNQITMNLEYSNRNTGETITAKDLVGTLNGDVIKFTHKNVEGTISLNDDNIFVSAYGGSGLNLSIGGAVCQLTKI